MTRYENMETRNNIEGACGRTSAPYSLTSRTFCVIKIIYKPHRVTQKKKKVEMKEKTLSLMLEHVPDSSIHKCVPYGFTFLFLSFLVSDAKKRWLIYNYDLIIIIIQK